MDSGRDLRRGERETKAQAGKSEELAERPKHDDVATRDFIGETDAERAGIPEGFIDHEKPMRV